MIDQAFTLSAFGILGLCFSGIFMVIFHNLFKLD
jgi:hypothetical protein